ncbi:MAG TPA: MmcQ/YjbR family DNA-binding protein [Alphaproteobacteria bacterium]|nr:MmcQ/YjbR family DNA-binding protein [Alphaproteobacteria bacterium]
MPLADAAELELRDYGLTFPEATEHFPWGDRVVKVRAKVFVFLGRPGGGLSVSAKLPVTGQEALILPFAAPTGYGLGRSGWVTARFEAGEEVPTGLLRAWIAESYRAVAPKRLSAGLGLDGAAPGPAAPIAP